MGPVKMILMTVIFVRSISPDALILNSADSSWLLFLCFLSCALFFLHIPHPLSVFFFFFFLSVPFLSLERAPEPSL